MLKRKVVYECCRSLTAQASGHKRWPYSLAAPRLAKGMTRFSTQ